MKALCTGRYVITGLLFFISALLLSGCIPTSSAGQRFYGDWTSIWSTAHLPQEVVYQDRTIRMRIRPASAGERFRIRLSNAVGKQSVVLRNMHVGIAGEGASIKPGTNLRVTFHNGLTEVQLPVGVEIFSDPIDLPFGAQDPLAISVYLPGAVQSPSGHARGVTFLTPDYSSDLAAQEAEAGFVESANKWFYVSAIEVLKEDARGVLVAIGDSITDGTGAPLESDWPRMLHERVLADGNVPIQAVLNAGIASNRLLADGCWIGGPQLQNRLVRDVITQAKASDVILLIGTNDIAVPAPSTLRSAQAIIDGLSKSATKLKSYGLNVIGATILPSKGGDPWVTHGDPLAIAIRNEVNDWIRQTTAFDAVVDFANVMADPHDPDRLNPAYDSGDGLHPNAKGYRAMAEAIDLGVFRGVRTDVGFPVLLADPAEACSPPA